MPLIAQLGRNFVYASDKESIAGSRLLALACGRVMQAQRIIGGKMAYIECGSNDKLYKFYSDNGFKMFGKRERDAGELAESPELIQMLKYFNS